MKNKLYLLLFLLLVTTNIFADTLGYKLKQIKHSGRLLAVNEKGEFVAETKPGSECIGIYNNSGNELQRTCNMPSSIYSSTLKSISFTNDGLFTGAKFVGNYISQDNDFKEVSVFWFNKSGNLNSLSIGRGYTVDTKIQQLKSGEIIGNLSDTSGAEIPNEKIFFIIKPDRTLVKITPPSGTLRYAYTNISNRYLGATLFKIRADQGGYETVKWYYNIDTAESELCSSITDASNQDIKNVCNHVEPEGDIIRAHENSYNYYAKKQKVDLISYLKNNSSFEIVRDNLQRHISVVDGDNNISSNLQCASNIEFSNYILSNNGRTVASQDYNEKNIAIFTPSEKNELSNHCIEASVNLVVNNKSPDDKKRDEICESNSVQINILKPLLSKNIINISLKAFDTNGKAIKNANVFIDTAGDSKPYLLKAKTDSKGAANLSITVQDASIWNSDNQCTPLRIRLSKKGFRNILDIALKLPGNHCLSCA